MTPAADRAAYEGTWPDRLMVVPEPFDKAFVERVKREVVEARRRCLQSFEMDATETASSPVLGLASRRPVAG